MDTVLTHIHIYCRGQSAPLSPSVVRSIYLSSIAEMITCFIASSIRALPSTHEQNIRTV